MTNGFERRREHSKEDIRRAAWELFSQFGVERVSVADIARKAGVSNATIYNNFGSKDVLTHEFVTTVVDQLIDQAQQALATGTSYQAKMTAFIGFLSAGMAGERPSVADRTVFTSSLDLKSDPQISRIRDSAQEKMTSLLLGLVQEGREQGEISPQISEEAFGVYFRAFMRLFTEPTLQHRFHSDPRLVRDLGTLMTDGLSGSRG